MITRLWNVLIGSPLATHEIAHKKLNKLRALAAFSPDALSSIAYANQEIFLALVAAGSAGLAFSFPVGVCIVALLVMVAASYYQTIHAYPSGGGSYVVARENLGVLPGLVAAAALMIDYVLTAAVSLTAGVEAIASAFPALWPYRVEAALFLLALILLVNLRGVQESGTIIGIPVYLFLLIYIAMLLFGFARATVEGPGSAKLTAAAPLAPLTLMLVLRAFASGSTALTGIEAISNGVPAFQAPESRNAGRTLIVMALLMGFLFLGSLGLTQYFGIVAGSQETILSALARRLVGNGLFYYLVQASTLLILTVAANTSFAGFPRIASILAQDKFLPRQLTNLGDRLVYSNGMLLLAASTAILVVLFSGQSHALVPLFAVGAFLAFTLSQAGMVVHWLQQRGQGWLVKSLINGVGALVTGLTLLIVGVSKFTHGAWLTLIFIPGLVWVFQQINRHYQSVAEQLSLRGLPPALRPAPRLRLVVPISGVHRATIEAINYARSISNQVTAVYIELEPGTGRRIRARWQEWFPDIPLEVTSSPYRSIIGPLLEFLDRTDNEHNDGQLAAVVLPEIIPANTWQALLHNQVAWLIKTALLYRRRTRGFQRVIIDIPYHLKE
ncbi:MAG TPA: APC family permease [Anaerolineales bacterium]|nr:APC family permease [Anaerolineales bacterium]